MRLVIFFVALIAGIAGVLYAQTSINLATQAIGSPHQLPVVGPGGTFGDAAHTLTLTIDQNGRVISVTANPLPPASSGAAQTGALAALPASCGSGSLYVATDQPAGEQLYICENGSWTQFFMPGPSGALAMKDGMLDIVTSVVPRLIAANTWTGANDFNAIQFDATTTAPPCSQSADIGRVWVDSTDPNNTGYKVCLASGGTIQWIAK